MSRAKRRNIDLQLEEEKEAVKDTYTKASSEIQRQYHREGFLYKMEKFKSPEHNTERKKLRYSPEAFNGSYTRFQT